MLMRLRAKAPATSVSVVQSRIQKPSCEPAAAGVSCNGFPSYTHPVPSGCSSHRRGRRKRNV